MSDEVGWRIENSSLKAADTIIKGFATNTVYNSRSLLKIFSKEQSLPLPNFKLSSRSDLRARLIETLTGKILATPNEITLNEIMQQYPDRILHWAACAVMRDQQNKDIGQFGGLVLDIKPPASVKQNSFQKRKQNDNDQLQFFKKTPSKRKQKPFISKAALNNIEITVDFGRPNANRS